MDKYGYTIDYVLNKMMNEGDSFRLCHLDEDQTLSLLEEICEREGTPTPGLIIEDLSKKDILTILTKPAQFSKKILVDALLDQSHFDIEDYLYNDLLPEYKEDYAEILRSDNND